MAKDKHHNIHRQGKTSFQAMLPEDESKLIERVKKLRGFNSGRELLVTLCKEEKQRHAKKKAKK